MSRTARVLLSFAVLMIYLNACENPNGNTSSKSKETNTKTDLTVLRGESALLAKQSSGPYQFSVDFGNLIVPAHGEFVPTVGSSYLFNQNLLLVPLFSGASSAYLFTKWGGHYYDPREVIGLTPERIRSPFVLDDTDILTTPINEVEFRYYVIDGPTALDDFSRQCGLVSNPMQSDSFVYYPQLESLRNMTIQNDEVTLICLLKQRVLRISRQSDVFSSDFSTRKNLSDTTSKDSFYNDYGDTYCLSFDMGGFVYLRNTFNFKNSPYTLLEIRTAIVDWASSFFNLSGIGPTTKKTDAVMGTIQMTLPYELANSGGGLTLPSFPKIEDFPQVLSDFTKKMKDGKNLWTTDIRYARY